MQDYRDNNYGYIERTTHDTPKSIPIGELIKLIDGRIKRIEQDGYVITVYNGHICFANKSYYDKPNIEDFLPIKKIHPSGDFLNNLLKSIQVTKGDNNE